MSMGSMYMWRQATATTMAAPQEEKVGVSGRDPANHVIDRNISGRSQFSLLSSSITIRSTRVGSSAARCPPLACPQCHRTAIRRLCFSTT